MNRTIKPLCYILTVGLLLSSPGSLSSYAAEISDTLETVPESQSSSENLTDIENDQPAQLPETDTVQSTEDSDTIPEEVEETLESEDFLEPEQDPTRDFVTRLYKVILLREPDTEGLNEWVKVLKSGKTTGAEVARDFIFSNEFINKKYSNDQFVELMYSSILGRTCDSEGKAAWLKILNNGFSRLYVCSGFIGSEEFTQLCQTYGIIRGSIVSDDIADAHPNITNFVARLYQLILSRNPDYNGLRDWVTLLVQHTNTAADVISGFVNSREFQNKGLSDQEYIEIMYQTILGRTSDSTGMNTWLGNLDAGMSRTFILYHFVYSAEFTSICAEYDVIKGEILLTEPRDMNKTITTFVNTAYKNCLNRSGTADDLNTWCQQLNNQSVTAQNFLESLIFSSESEPEKLSNEAFVQRLYATLLQRTPSSSELSSGVNSLRNGTSQADLFNAVTNTDEFKTLLKNIGLFSGRYYQNPSQYYQIQDSIQPLSGGGYELNMGYMGVKVSMVQKKLGLGNRRAIVDITFTNAVKKFQTQKGLKVDGIVGLQTWKALGFSEYDWYNVGTYISPLLVNENSNRSDHIEAMINTAYTYLGTEYVIGAAGKPGTGIDCSGLVMQGLYSAGIDLSPINPIRHSQPGYEYESRNMFASSKFKHISYAERQRGDLIFYQNSSGVIIHVAIYLGNDQVIEAWPPQVVVWPIINAQRSIIAGVARPFV